MAAVATTTESRDPSHNQPSRNDTFKPRSWGPKSPKALVFNPWKPVEVTEEEANEQNSKIYPYERAYGSDGRTEASNSFEVQLPRWRNRVHVYEDPAKTGYICTLRLDRVGFIKNCKRRLGYDYKVLHVKGEKPGLNKCDDAV